MKISRVYLCELIQADDSTRVSCLVYKTRRSARAWQLRMIDDPVEGFSVSDRLGCVAVIREMKVHP
jgi:hypothetical protein